jgi:hypothetical protein
VPLTSITDPATYEFFAGLDAGDKPLWSSDPDLRQPVFSDATNGVMRISVSYNPGLRRYLLTTQQVSRFQTGNGHIGIYDAPEPWGPWTTLLFANPWTLGLQNGSKTVFWNFSNKWSSADGVDFVMVYTGPGSDSWGTVEGSFEIAPCTLPDDDLELRDGIVTGSEEFEACSSIKAGPAYTIQGQATLRTRGEIILDDGFAVLQNGELTAEIDPLTGL